MPSLNVNRYFSSKAPGYSSSSGRGLWRWIRKNESGAVLAMLGELKGLKIVDLGAGTGFYSCLCLEKGAGGVLAVDACPEMLARINDGRVETKCADIGAFSCDAEFDRLVCAGALEFTPDPQAVLSAARKIAGRGCVFVLLVPRLSFLSVFYFLFHLSHGIRVRLFSDAAVSGLAQKSGWRVRDSIRVFPFAGVFRLDPVGE